MQACSRGLVVSGISKQRCSAFEPRCLCAQRILSVDYRLPPNKVVSNECKDLLRCRPPHPALRYLRCCCLFRA